MKAERRLLHAANAKVPVRALAEERRLLRSFRADTSLLRLSRAGDRGGFVPGLREKRSLPVARGIAAFPLGKLKGEGTIRRGSCNRWIYGLFGASCTNFANAVCLQALNSCIPG